MKLGAAVVLYNPSDYEIEHILRYAKQVEATIVVDNTQASNAVRVQRILAPVWERVEYKHYAENIGLCRALNLAIDRLGALGCDWVFVADQDSEPQNDILGIYEQYLKSQKNADIAILGPVFDYDRRRVKPYEGMREVKRIMLSGNLINVQIFCKEHGFMEELFVDGLDWEYCLRVRKHGYRILECGNAVLRHQPGETKTLRVFGKVVLRYGYHSPERYYMQARASSWLFLHYHDQYDLLCWMWKLAKIIFLFDRKREYFKQFYAGTKNGIELKEQKNYIGTGDRNLKKGST